MFLVNWNVRVVMFSSTIGIDSNLTGSQFENESAKYSINPLQIHLNILPSLKINLIWRHQLKVYFLGILNFLLRENLLFLETKVLHTLDIIETFKNVILNLCEQSLSIPIVTKSFANINQNKKIVQSSHRLPFDKFYGMNIMTWN